MNMKHLKLQQGELPNGARYSCAHMLPSERTQFPEDRALNDRRNRQELAAKKGRVMRRTLMEIPALGGETLEIEYAT